MAKLTPEQHCLNLDTSLGCQYRGKPCPQAVIEYVEDGDSSMWGSQRFETGAKCGLTEEPLTFGENLERPRGGRR